MKPIVAVDTNVAIVANGKSEQACIVCTRASIAMLREIRSQRRVLLDELGLILKEYRRHLLPRGQPGLGDAFFKWLWSNQANPQICSRVVITPSTGEDGTFVEFPTTPDLTKFDHSDRKFVAAILASGERVPLINAVDTDWWVYREALRRHGVEIVFLCPDLMH